MSERKQKNTCNKEASKTTAAAKKKLFDCALAYERSAQKKRGEEKKVGKEKKEICHN